MGPKSSIWLVTGPPGIGKSTVVSKVVYKLRSQGHAVGGCITKEKRENGERTGFTIIDLLSGRHGELATVQNKLGPRVGKYRVNLVDLASIGATALNEAANMSEVIVIDELGPMELTSREFRKAAEHCIKKNKPVLAVVHQRMKDPLIQELESIAGVHSVAVSLENRDRLAERLANEITETLLSYTRPLGGQG